MRNELEDKLVEIGFSQKEAGVYLALLELGPVSVGMVVQATKLYRVIVYEIVQKLIEKGFVSYFLKNNRRQFRAEGPEKIWEVAKEKEAVAKKLAKELALIIPTPAPEKQALIFENISGIRSAQENYFKIMKKNSNEEYLMFGASLQLHEKLDAFFNYFHERRAKLGIRARLLHNENNRAYGDLKKKYIPVEVRYMPENIITPSWISMYGDMMLIGVMAEEPFAFFIKNSKVVESYKKYFELLWKMGKQ